MANTKFNAYTAVKLQCDFDYGLPRHLQRTRSAKFPAPLATSTECEVPRATCNEREARSSPRKRQDCCCRECRRFFMCTLFFREYNFLYRCHSKFLLYSQFVSMFKAWITNILHLKRRTRCSRRALLRSKTITVK